MDATHISRAKDPAIVQEAQRPIEFISGIFTKIAIVLVILGLVFWIRGCRAEAKAKTEAAEANVRVHPSAITRVGREKKLYHFSEFPNGIIIVEIKLGEVDFYPKGGKVKITPPPPATPWVDEPGTSMPRVERPPGWYTVVGVDPNAWGIDIWN